mmetsp:Transcript_14601/g.23788  ORF Transcript_14601/g.23788 Transcript_14601/m.23788 type:complete len:376 (-) Transcript_14601:936-2063(-)
MNVLCVDIHTCRYMFWGFSSLAMLAKCHPNGRLLSLLLLSDTIMPSPSSRLGGEPLLDLLRGICCVSKQHIGVVFVEDWVIYTSISGRHGALHEDDLLGLPDLDDRHAGDTAVGIVLRCAVDRVVGTDHHRDVHFLHLIVDFLHLVHDVVWNPRLREQHVQLPGHAAGHGVHGEFHRLALIGQMLGDVRDRLLCLRHGQTVPGNDAHARCVLECLNCSCNVDLCVHEAFSRLHGAGLGSEAAKDNVGEGAVHSVAHNLGEEGPARADEGADDSQQRLVQDEPLRAQRPPGVGVEQSNDDRHISASDRSRHMETKSTAEGHAPCEACRAHGRISSSHEADHACERPRAHSDVHCVAPGEGERLRIHLLSELEASDD